jgi:transposase
MDIKALKAQGFSQRAVARLLGVHRDAVRRIWSEDVPRLYRRPPRHEVDAQGAHRHGWERRLAVTRLYREVRERGEGSWAIRSSAGLEEGVPHGRRRRFETGPEQAQADWGETRQMRFASGEVLTRYFFTMVLAFSRLRFVLYLPEVTQAWLLWAHTRAFNFFGGVPRTILYDNPKQIVQHPRPDVVWQQRLLAFASHYGYVPQACWPARPQTKGKVENAVGFHERDFLLGLEPLPKDDAELNAGARLVRRGGSACVERDRSAAEERWLEEKPYPAHASRKPLDCRTVETAGAGRRW